MEEHNLEEAGDSSQARERQQQLRRSYDASPSLAIENPPDLNDWYSGVIEKARNGDHDCALLLLEIIARTNTKAALREPLQKYLFDCLSTWLESGCQPNSAKKAFHLSRGIGRPVSATHDKYRRVWRAYLISRARGEGYAAAIEAGVQASANLGSKAIESLVTGKNIDELAQVTALMEIRHEDCELYKLCIDWLNR